MSKIGGGFQIGLSWVPSSSGDLPPGAISVGDGVYVARMRHEGETIPGKFVARYEQAYCPYGGREHTHRTYEVLCDTSDPKTSRCYTWECANNGHVPKYAIVAGLADNGAPLFVAKSEIHGEPVVGKVHRGHDCAYFSYGGEEHSRDHYEVLVLQK